jgi:thiosulfate dehydrogenase
MNIHTFLTARYRLACIVLILNMIAWFIVLNFKSWFDNQNNQTLATKEPTTTFDSKITRLRWNSPDSTLLANDPDRELIRYGKQLVEHTAVYLGPKGKVRAISNGMNCQNCHLAGGTKVYGNNFSAVASTYPKFRPRSGTIESIEKRINDCIERSLNGAPLEQNSKELKAMAAYIVWVGKLVEHGKTPDGAGLWKVPLLTRAASPERGKKVYANHCKRCHGGKAEGLPSADSLEWIYPPLAGQNSYNTGAGLFRISRFAGFVKANMPWGVTFENPMLTNEEAWDVAAFVNSLPRPSKPFDRDWPDISTKPFDHPLGPYADSLSEKQHKYGPFLWTEKVNN